MRLDAEFRAATEVLQKTVEQLRAENEAILERNRVILDRIKAWEQRWIATTDKFDRPIGTGRRDTPR